MGTVLLILFIIGFSYFGIHSIGFLLSLTETEFEKDQTIMRRLLAEGRYDEIHEHMAESGLTSKREKGL